MNSDFPSDPRDPVRRADPVDSVDPVDPADDQSEAAIRKQEIKRRILIGLGIVAGLGLALFLWIWMAPCFLGGCAPLDDLAEYQAEGSVLLDIDGEPFGTLATVNRTIVSIDSLPDHVPQAFVAIEDRRFYDHSGVDFQRLAGAVLSNVRAGGVAEGGSTITQQLARNLFPEWLPYQERSLRRKIMEARVARQIERNFDKDKILELYINHIYLGEGAYGIEAAARTYFNKPAAELTVVEAAMIGGIPVSPSRINPVADIEAARERRDLVLGAMAEEGYITVADADSLQAEDIALSLGEVDDEAVRGSYFIERVRQEMEEAVGSRFYTAGLKIHTTMDSGAQRAAEQQLARQLEAIEAGGFGAYRHATYPSDEAVAESGQTPYAQGAVVLMDVNSGEVRALVGGRDFEDSKFDRATQALRQAGSSFKPFVYAVGLERFGSPVHTVQDQPVRMVLSGGRTWEPRNYTGRYDGPMTMREAITRSKNAATVHLSQETGIDAVIATAHELGITSDIENVPSTALGVAAVRPIEMATAYAAFANGGNLVEPHYIRRVVDRHGRTVWEATTRSERVMDPATAFVLTSMLRDVVDRGTGTAARVGGYSGPAAGKTGTTNNAADVWFIGYTPELVAAVWMGMDDPQTLVPGASGGTLAAPVWGRLMGAVYSDRPAPQPWSAPSGVSTAEVERATGMIVGPGCPARGPTYTEYFVGGAPVSGMCQTDTIYPRMAYDSIWMDEEWGAGMDTLGGDLDRAGIDWPELEELRRRIRMGDSIAPTDTIGYPTDMPRPVTIERDDDPPPPAPTPTDTSGGTPPVLGEPVRRDSLPPANRGGTLPPAYPH
jgi:penicillin-binding protein 1A